MKVKKTFTIKKIKSISFFALNGLLASYAINVFATCPIVVSSNSSFPVDDMAEAGCSIIVNSGVTLSTMASEGITINLDPAVTPPLRVDLCDAMAAKGR
jgi:hypothetical protein